MVSRGEVISDSNVDSRAPKCHAEHLAESCSGVKRSQNNLDVRDRQTSTGRSLGNRSGSTDTDKMGANSTGASVKSSIHFNFGHLGRKFCHNRCLCKKELRLRTAVRN